MMNTFSQGNRGSLSKNNEKNYKGRVIMADDRTHPFKR